MKTANYEIFIEVNSSREIHHQERRDAILKRFPYSAIVEGHYPEGDTATRWCWQQFGPMNCEECYDYSSEYPGCPLVLATEYTETGVYKDKNGEEHRWQEKRYKKPEKHNHEGIWEIIWLGKTGYDYGFYEFCFKNEADRDKFLEAAPSFGFGENYE